MILAIDWGKKRMGCARGDARARLPEPFGSFVHDDHIFQQIRSTVEAQQVNTIVVGLPRNMSGEETRQSREVRQFVAELKNQLQCPIVLQDETLTSHYTGELRQRFPDADTDSLAATLILGDYLQSI
jgi:putative Holliday junction resolvase